MVVVVAPLEIKEKIVTGAGELGCPLISKTYIDAEFDVESFRMVYLASKGRLGKVICEKHTFLNNLWPPTVRVSLHSVRPSSSTFEYVFYVS